MSRRTRAPSVLRAAVRAEVRRVLAEELRRRDREVRPIFARALEKALAAGDRLRVGGLLRRG